MDELQQWLQRLDDYVRWRGEVGRAPATLDTVRSVLRLWIPWALEQGIDPGEFDDEAIDAFCSSRDDINSETRRTYSGHVRRWRERLPEFKQAQKGVTQASSCWVVRAGSQGEAVEHNLRNDVVTIAWRGWGDWSELEQCESRDEVDAFVDDRCADMSENDRRSARSQVGAFVADIQEGDLVVMPMKGVDGNPIAIGRVDGPFEFDPAQRDDVQKRRSVTWLSTEIERDVIGQDLLSSINSSGTVFGLRAHDAARRVLHLAEHGTDPGRGDPEPPPDDPDLLGDRLDRAARELLCGVEFLNDFVELLEDKGQVILYGPPGTGKTYFARQLAWTLTGIADDDEYENEGPYSLVQFHPAYSYEDFFEGFRPQVDDDGQMTYELTPGPLVRLAERAAENPDERHVMVIDEINRANLPRVLGELLYLLEYRDEWTQTQYRPVDGFALPSNLWIIGTMNTADRSIALIDAAMRRRFHFVPFFPDREPTAGLLRRWCERNDPGQAWVADLLDGVNERLRADLGDDYMLIGPSHFMKQDLDENSLRRIWEYNIEPLIEDQFFGRQDVIDSYRFGEVWKRHGPGSAAPASETGTSDGPGEEAEPRSAHDESPESQGDG